MDETNETVSLAMKIIDSETRSAQQTVHGHSCLGLEERWEGVECGKPVRNRRIRDLANAPRLLVASMLVGLLWTEVGIGHSCRRGGEGRGGSAGGLALGPQERMLFRLAKTAGAKAR